MIDNRAIVHPNARIDEDVFIGPFSIIGENVEIGKGSHIGPSVVINGPTRIGVDNRIFQFSSIGDDPQDKKYQGDEESSLEIGDGNTIREFCTINRGTEAGGGVTRIGNENWFMAYVHIAHDCRVGNHTVFANNATLAGHVTIEDHVILGGFTGVHQFCKLGQFSFTAISSVIIKDVPPYLLVSGNTARPVGLNREGLKRHDFSAASIDLLRKAFRIVYRSGLVLDEALKQLQPLAQDSPEVAGFAKFISESERGIVR